jgi:transcriptional regulator with XRE-family HTH domain
MKQPELGRKVLELRQKSGLTQTELAEKCKLSLRTVQRIEASEVTPRNYTVRTILGALGHIHRPQEAPKWYDMKQLFNLKIDAMKKLSVLTLFVGALVAGILFTASAVRAQKVEKIEGWHLSGSHTKSYKIGLDKGVFKTGKSSAFLGSVDKKIDGFGTLMQSSSAEEYLGKRVKMTAWVKSENVADWAGMWLRVDGKDKMLSFDNMQNRPIKGTGDWKKCEIVLDVPAESVSLNFGILLAGTGKVWFDDIAFEVVGDNTSLTDILSNGSPTKQPANLGFDK